MAVQSGGNVDWNVCIKPMLVASHGSFNKNDIPDLVKAISRSKQDILKHDNQYASFYSSFSALSAHYLSTSAAYVPKNQLMNVSQACKVLLEFFLQKLQHFNEQCCLSQKELMLLIKGLCKGVGFLQRSDVITLTAMLKAAKVPQTNAADVTTGEESRESSRTRQDPSSVILEQLISPLHDIAEKRKSDGSPEAADRDLDTSIGHSSNSSLNFKNLFASKNVINLQQLNAGDILISMCLSLPYLHRYVVRCTDALNDKGFLLPTTVSDAASVRSSFQLLLNDINIVWRALSLPILEPLHDDRLSNLTTVVTSCMYAAITVAMANSIQGMSGSSSSKANVSKDDDLDNCAVGIVEKSMEIFNYVSLAIHNSTRAGGHNLQNLQMIVAWTLLMGLQHMLFMTPVQSASADKNKDASSKSQSQSQAKQPESASSKQSKDSGFSGTTPTAAGRQSLIKVQQGFGVLSVGLASQTLHLLVALLEDLQVEGALLPATIDVKNIDGSSVSFNVQGRYSAWQRMQKLLSHFNLTNLLFNLAAITYRKACMLKRVQKHLPDGETFSTSDSSSCCPDDISWSDDTSGDEDDDSEPILGQWFEETVAPKEPSTATVTQPAQPLPDSTSTDHKLTPIGSLDPGNLIPEKGEPHGFIALASSIFVFMNQHILSSDCQLMRSYARGTLSEQHMIILAGIIRDLDRETSRNESGVSNFGSVVSKLYEEFSLAIAKYSHNLLATGALSESLQNLLLSQLGVCPFQQEDWPLQVYPRTLAIVAQVFLLRQQKEKDELKSESEAACVLIWKRFLQTLQKNVLNPQSFETSTVSSSSNLPPMSPAITVEDIGDLNVEHAQLLLFLFHSLQLMQKKTVLLDCAHAIMNLSGVTQTCMSENQLLIFSRLLLVFEYLMKNLYEAPSSLIEQIQANLFNLQSTSAPSDSDKDMNNKPSKFYFPCKDIDDNYSRNCDSEEVQGGIKPRFYNLVNVEVGNMDVPKLDGFSSNFLLGTPDVLPYQKFYPALITILGIGGQCDIPSRITSKKLSYLGQCAVQYCFTIAWRLLLSLPPSVAFLQSLATPAPETQSNALPLSLIWIPRTAHKGFAAWLKDCLIKQGLTTQKAESLLRTLTNNCNNVTYDVEQAKNAMQSLLSKYSDRELGTVVPRQALPQLFQTCVLDSVIAKLQVTVDETFSKPITDTEPKTKLPVVASDLLPEILQLIELYSTFIRSSLLYQMNDAADPPGEYSQHALIAHGLTVALSSSRCPKSSAVALPIALYTPAPLRTALDRWNANSLSEFPAICAWRNAFANDPIPSESYVCAIQMCHIAALSSQPSFNSNLALKHTLHALVRFVGDLIIPCQDEKILSEFVDVLFPLILDASTENLADFVTLALERFIGSSESDDYLEKVYFQTLKIGNLLLTNHSDKDSGMDERIFHDLLRFIESMLENAPGKKALEKFFGKNKDFSDILLSSSNEHLSVSYGTKVLKLFNKLFQLAEKSPEDQSLEMLCSSLGKLAKVSCTTLQEWLAKMICGPLVPNEDANALQENRLLLQSLASYIVQENSHVDENVASALLHALTPMATKILMCSSDGVGFPELMVVMASLAGAGGASGHIPLLKSVSFWLCQCKKYLCEKDVTEKLQNGVLSGKHQTMMESVCCILSYLTGTLGALKPSTDKYLMNLRSGMTSPPPDGDLPHLDIDSDWADDLGQDDDESAGEDSDEDSLSNKLCTFTVTQKEFMNQHWYHCHTCKMVDGVGVCSICAKVCHKDHDVTYAKHGSFFCDCGAKEDGSCQALMKRTATNNVDPSVLASIGPSAFSANTLPSSLRRRSSSPATNDRNNETKKSGSLDDGSKLQQSLSKQLEPLRENILSSSLSLPKIATDILEMLQSLKPAIETNCYQNSPVGSNTRIQKALQKLHETDKTFETTDQLMVPTLGSQEGAFENVRMNYSGDQGQTIRQLIGAHMIRRVAMCVLASSKGKRQHLAVSHEKGKITILQLSSLLKQADSSKRKLTLTRLSSAPVPFTVLSIAGNPCNEEFVAVCGLKDCHILTFTPTGSIADHLALQPQPAVGNFIIKAVWLPGSQTELALVMPDFVKIYDLAVDALSPQYYFLLPIGKIRDCCFAFTEDGQRHLLLMSSAGHIYTQVMCDESSAKHGPFYVTTILEVKHADLKDSNGQFGGGGVSIYYSHTLQLLFFSYVHGKSFISPMPKMVPELTQLHSINFKTNGGGKPNNQPLCQWSEVPNHPGLICCLTQTNNNPVVIMIKPDTILIQEIKLVSSKSRITDMVAIRHQSSSGDQRTTIILLCEDGSLRIYMANVDHTGFWLTPAHQNISAPSTTRPPKKKKSTKAGRPTGSVAFPVDFFEHCVPLNELEFGGNDVLQIYNTQQIKHRLNTTGMYIASTKPAGFTIEATNPDPSMVMTGVRIMVGGLDIQRAPAYIEIFNRTVQVTLTRSRWYDFPFTREESLQADKKVSVFFGASSYPSGVTIVDSIKIYGKSKDTFGWPEDNDEFPTNSPTTAVTAVTTQTGDGEGGASAAPLPLTSLDRLLAGSLELLDNCFSVMPAGENKHTLRPVALDLATQLLTLPTPPSVQQQTKGLLMALLANKVAYHNHKDHALLSDVSSCLSDMQESDSGKQLDVESYYNLVITARSVAVSRPQNLVRFADSLEEIQTSLDDSINSKNEPQAVTSSNHCLSLLNSAERRTFLGQLMLDFWKLHDAQPCNPSLAPVSQPGLTHLEAIVQALVEIIPAFASCDVDNVNLASKLYVQLLLCDNPTVSFVCKQALTRALRPRYHRHVCIPSPPICTTPGNAGSENREDAKLSLPLASVTASQGASEMDGIHEAAAAMLSSVPLESLLAGQVSFSPMLDMPPDADDETMVELAIALSLQDQSNQPADLGLQNFSLGEQARRTSSLERAQFSDTTASPGVSDDEGSTAATDGSTLRTPPAEQGGSVGSESGGSGIDSITGEHNVSGRSSANGDNVPESTTTGARSETSSIGMPSTSMQPYPDGGEVEAEAEMDGDTTLRLQQLRLLLLEKFLQHVPRLREISGIRAIPFLQVILMLASDLDGDNEKDRAVLDNLLSVMIGELEMGSKEAANMAERSPRHEVQLVIMRLLSVMISRTKTTGKSTAGAESSAFISSATASALVSNGAVPYCLQVLKSLLDYWKHYQADDFSNSYALAAAGAGVGPPKGGLLKPHPVFPLPNMSPFFLRQYVKGHANDVFEAYPQLLTEMVLRLPYQIKKMADNASTVATTSSSVAPAIPAPVFDQAWFYFLCEYMMTQQTPFVRKQVRKLLLFICGSKDRYRQLRDLYVLESNLKEAKVLCALGGYTFQNSSSNVIQTTSQSNSGERNNAITLPYDTLITLIEHIRSCVEIASSRTLNWQHFCEKDESVIPFLVQVSFLLDEGVSPIILQLLQCALSTNITSQSVGTNTSKTAQQQGGSNKQPKEQDKSTHTKEDSPANGESVAAIDNTRLPCAVLVQQVNKYVDRTILSCFIKAFLLESNQSAVRWQAHSLILSLFTHSTSVQQEALLDLMWKLWPQLPSFVRKAAQFVDLLGYFAVRIPPNERKAQEYVDRACSLLQEQNRILAYHPNAALYTAFQALVEFDGYYLESEPCLVCNDPEVPMANVKLSALKMDSCFTTTTQIVKLIGSHVISKIVLRIGDLKRSKMVRTICFHYNNRSVQAVVELKNKPAMWHKAKRCTLAAGQTELKVEFPLPIVACNLMIEYAEFYENVQASSETLQCPRCSASVPANPGVCANCGENVFQCHKCRAINYDEKDPFLCNTCGFCKYSKFDYTLTAKPCCAVDPIENEEDRKKAVTTINTLLEKADRVYRQLVANKPVLEVLLARINEHSFEIPGEDGGASISAVTAASANVAAAGTATVGVNKAIQQLAQRYCGDCKSAFEDLGKIIQKVLATRKELVEYDRQQRESGMRTAGPTTPISRESLLRSLSGPANTTETQSLSSGRCYGCASAATEHCITLLRALATDEHTRLVQCGQGLIRELVDYNLRQGSVQVCNEVRQLLCLLTRDNPKGTEELNAIIMEKISLAHRSQMNSSDFAASVHHEMALLAASVQRYDSCWEQRLRCVMNLFLLGVNSKSPVVMETITLPCLCILQSLIKPAPPVSKKNKDKTIESLTTVKVEGTDVRIDLQKWLAGDSHHSFNNWKRRVPPNVQSSSESTAKKKPKKEDSRESMLISKYGNRWRRKARKDILPIKLVDSEWLRHVLFNPPSHSARQEACNMVESLCAIPTRKKEILDLLTTFLDDLGKSGESAAEFLALYQNLIKTPQWKSYLAIRGVLPHIGNLITKEISHLTWLEETTLKTDLCEGYALKMLTELLSSFIEQDNIRRHYKSRLVGTVLNGYLSLRKLVIQRTKMVDETQEKLLELLEEMTTGNEAETQAFMSVCVETVKKYPLDDYRTPVFIFERLCSIIYPEENDMGEYFVTLDKDPQQEDFLQGRMLGNPYSSNEPGVGPLMRDIKNKICQDCELVALLEDDNGMELLVNNKIISLDLPVKEVYKKVWLVENAEGEAMRIVYRMRGLLGDATEEFIESLDARSNEEVDNEEVYKMANWMSQCGGLAAMLERLGSLNDVSRGRSLLTVLLKLFNFCTKVKSNRQALAQPEMKSLSTMLHVLRLALNADIEQLQGQPGGPTITEQLLQIMETILLEASSLTVAKYTVFTETCGTESDIQFLLEKMSSSAVHNSSPVLQCLMRVLPFLVFASPPKLTLLVNYFKPCSNFNHFDDEHTSSDDLKMECLCRMANSIEQNALGDQLKNMIIEAGIVRNALDYIQQHAPPIRSALLLDSDELKEFISKPSLKYILRLLTGLSHGHEATQVLVSTDCIPIIHRLEQVSSDEHVGSLAENLMEALRGNSNVAQKIEDVRKLTRAEKKRLAMAMREKQLAGLGMSTNEKGQVTAKSPILQQMEELGEETGLVCVICREGYRFQPTKVLGIYTYTKRCNADEFENKPRKTPAYSTVTHFNVTHVDCHAAAVRLARGRDEWESAALQNANTRCNGLLPLWGPQVPESAFASCLARHNTYLQECTGHRDIGYPSTFHDLKLLLMRFANEKSFSEDSGGGGPQSNLHLIPYLIHMALYVINTTRSAAKEDKNATTFLELPPEKWIENSFEADGPLYATALVLCVRSFSKWQEKRLEYVKRLLVLAHARHVAPQGTTKITDKEVKEYSVYKPVLLFFGMVHGLYTYLFKKVAMTADSDWPSSLAEYIRNNDQQISEGCDKLLSHYQDELLPCQSFAEFCDVVGLLEDIPNPDEFVSGLLSKLVS